MNHKAFIFSVDAVMAVLVVILVFSVLALNYLANSTTAGMAFESASKKALDRAVVGFYLGTTPIPTESLQNKSTGKCYTVIYYDPNNLAEKPDNTTGWKKNIFCEGFS